MHPSFKRHPDIFLIKQRSKDYLHFNRA